VEALEARGSASAVLNAANEAAVDLFLKEKLSFMGIPHMIERALSDLSGPVLSTYEEVVHVDQLTRRYVLDAAGRNTFTL
ncbi:MAG: 1-deoxy-D-xylulose-5-phosphate reductoisomerase, partial [Bacteroidetes bacterium]|nr:1-deoxy-D-xylulose-5-phosphate reductoisomerase [Bacteroidota bacterium]